MKFTKIAFARTSNQTKQGTNRFTSSTQKLKPNTHKQSEMDAGVHKRRTKNTSKKRRFKGSGGAVSTKHETAYVPSSCEQGKSPRLAPRDSNTRSKKTCFK